MKHNYDYQRMIQIRIMFVSRNIFNGVIFDLIMINHKKTRWTMSNRLGFTYIQRFIEWMRAFLHHW